jgi:hypothetical protein
MAGALKRILTAVQTSPYMQGVSVVFGDEEINMQRYTLPLVVMTPKGGTFSSPGYAQGLDPNTYMSWETYEMVEFWLWNAASDLANQSAIDHTDAIEDLRALMLGALQYQLASYSDASTVTYGIVYKVMGGRWEVVGQNAVSRFGRAYVLTVQFTIPVVLPPPTEVVIDEVTVVPDVNVIIVPPVITPRVRRR